jgi:hypothetical protein
VDTFGGVIPNASLTTTVAPAALFILPTANLAENQSGSIRIAHNCGYGGLSGKAVSIEPATGFTFDTAMSHRPH